MSVLPLVTVVALLAGLVAALVLLARTGEMRAGVLAAVLALLVVHPALTLWQEPARPLGLDAATAADGAYLLASLLCLFVVVALWRTLGERDRIESLHWDAMEGVRALGELAGSRSADFDANLDRLLEIGCTCFGVEVGVASRVRGKRYEVIAIRAPESFPVAKGSVFPLEETCCAGVLGGDRPVALSGAGPRPAPNAFRFQAYLGAEVPLADGVYGTLCFASVDPRKAVFTATDKDLLRVMAQWLGTELERRDRSRAPARRHARAGEPERSGAPRRRQTPAPRHSVDLNDVLGRVRRQLEATAGPRIELDMRAAPDLRAAQDHHLPLDAIVLSLVRNAVDAMPEGGKLTLETANLEVGASEPGVVPAVEPNRYVTLTVRDTGSSLDAGALARVFEPPPPDADERGRMPLAEVYRLLQRCGGDLSVNVEPGRGTDFTLFLPLADARPAPAPASSPPPVPSALPSAS